MSLSLSLSLVCHLLTCGTGFEVSRLPLHRAGVSLQKTLPTHSLSISCSLAATLTRLVPMAN